MKLGAHVDGTDGADAAGVNGEGADADSVNGGVGAGA